MKKTAQWFIGLLLMCSMAVAQEIDATYSVSFGIFGEMGVSQAHFKSDKGRYTITIDAAATGMAKSLSRNRIEKHTSEGTLSKGRLMAHSYRVSISYGEKRKEKLYTFDYGRKRITKTIQKYKGGKLVSQSSETLPFFTSDDLLTLYFNLPLLLDQNAKPGLYRFKTAGAEIQDGSVEVRIPDQKALGAYKAVLGEGEYRYMTAIIHQKIFDSSRGELLIAVGKDGITQKAVLKDLIMFGDLVAQRIK